MLFKSKHRLLATSLCFASIAISSSAFAVGGGIVFNVDEAPVPARPNAFQADSMDFTYHSCVKIVQSPDDPNKNMLHEMGYFWISSYQDVDSVVDSQINYFQNNGYHIYGVYSFEAKGLPYPSPLGQRADYRAAKGSISLYLDPDQNTVLDLANCVLSRKGTDDDSRIGGSNTVVAGEKTEKALGLANGDFDVRFVNWMWDDPCPIVPFPSDMFVFNANVTRLIGPLLSNHRNEGSGNLYWKFE